MVSTERRCSATTAPPVTAATGPAASVRASPAGESSTVYPDPADQVAVVTNGRGGMPAFGDKLTEEEIAAVVEYTRTVLAGG